MGWLDARLITDLQRQLHPGDVQERLLRPWRKVAHQRRATLPYDGAGLTEDRVEGHDRALVEVFALEQPVSAPQRLRIRRKSCAIGRIHLLEDAIQIRAAWFRAAHGKARISRVEDHHLDRVVPRSDGPWPLSIDLKGARGGCSCPRRCRPRSH